MFDAILLTHAILAALAALVAAPIAFAAYHDPARGALGAVGSGELTEQVFARP